MFYWTCHYWYRGSMNPELASLFSLALELVAHPSKCRLENDQYVSILCLNGTSPILFILGWLFYIQSKSMIIDHQCQYSVNMIVNMCQCHLHQSIISPLEEGPWPPLSHLSGSAWTTPTTRSCQRHQSKHGDSPSKMRSWPSKTLMGMWRFTMKNEKILGIYIYIYISTYLII